MTTAILIICYLKQVGLRILQVSLDRIWPSTAIYLPARDHILITIISTDKSPLKINLLTRYAAPVACNTKHRHCIHFTSINPHTCFSRCRGVMLPRSIFGYREDAPLYLAQDQETLHTTTSCDEQSTDEKRKQTETVIMRSTHKITRPSIKLW